LREDHFLAVPFPFNVTTPFRKAVIDLLVGEDRACCRVIAALAWRLLDSVSLQSFPIPEETEDEAAETEMELYLNKWFELLYELDDPDAEEKHNEKYSPGATIRKVR
jgi:hypothetical protein